MAGHDVSGIVGHRRSRKVDCESDWLSPDLKSHNVHAYHHLTYILHPALSGWRAGRFRPVLSPKRLFDGQFRCSSVIDCASRYVLIFQKPSHHGPARSLQRFKTPNNHRVTRCYRPALFAPRPLARCRHRHYAAVAQTSMWLKAHEKRAQRH
jgi:hypothetical protein